MNSIHESKKVYVEILPFNGDTSDPGYARMGPMTRREAERVERGANINLNHEHYYTRIAEAPDE